MLTSCLLFVARVAANEAFTSLDRGVAVGLQASL
jgi:hypothetical protein